MNPGYPDSPEITTFLTGKKKSAVLYILKFLKMLSSGLLPPA
jgi:hypothetical protein